MSECKHQCIVLKRICIFIVGVVIGFGGGFKYHQDKVQHRVHDRLLKQAEKPLFKRYGKQPESRVFLTRDQERKLSYAEKKTHKKRESPDEISFDYVVSGMCERQKCQATIC